MLNVSNINAASKLLNNKNLLNNTQLSSNDVQTMVSIFDAVNSNSSVSSTSSVDSFLNSSIFAAEDDGKDDGKLTFGESVKSIFKGAVKSFTNMFSSPENIAKTVIGGVACAALIAVTGGAATPFIIAGGAVMGGIQVGKGVYDASQAKTDDEKRAALENVGSGTATIAMSLAAGKAYSNATGSSLTSISTYKEAAANSINNAQSFMKLTPSAAKAEIASVTSLDQSINWMQDENALNQMYENNSTDTMKKFGYQLIEGYSKNNEEAISKKKNIFA